MIESFSTSVIELSKNALRKNLEYIRTLIGEDVLFSSVVKGNAYGHGLEYFVPMAEECGVNHFSVFSADEASRVFSCSKSNPTILIMGMIDYEQFEWAIKNEIEFFVFDIHRLENAIYWAKKINKSARIHIELETGFNRTGFNRSDFDKITDLINENSNNLSIEGICTHFAGAESIANYYRIQKQIRLFNKYCGWFEQKNIKAKLRHAACSAAAITYPKTRYDMVRIGILQYGYWPTKETLINHLSKKKSKYDPLIRVITWKCNIMTTKTVPTGEFIGYGTSYLAQRDTKIGIVPVGYAQGYSRSLSNLGRALIRDQRVSVIGIVNMNLLVLDITDVPDVSAGDEVVLIGDQGELSISVSSFSDLSDQLNYESLTRLPENIRRVIKE